MAVIGDFEVVIEVDGQPLAEYDEPPALDPVHPRDQRPGNIEESSKDKQCFDAEGTSVDEHSLGDNDKTQTCKYVEATPGTKYIMRYRILPAYRFEKANFVLFSTCVDGRLRVYPIITKAHQESGNASCLSTGIQYLNHGQWFQHDFLFGSLTIVDNDDSKVENETRIGSIVVEVWPEKGREHSFSTPTTRESMTGTVHEKTVKGKEIDQFTRLGSATETAAVRQWTGIRVANSALAVFKFFYRSREGLMKLGVIERPKPPTPLRDRDPATLNAKELKQLVQELKNENETHRIRIKRENAEETSRQLNPLKRLRAAFEADDGDDDDDDVVFVSCEAVGPKEHNEVL